MNKRLKILLLEGWEDVSHENPDGPSTFIRSESENPAVLQISVQATYTRGKKPDPTVAQLFEFARRIPTKDDGQEVMCASGDCKMGIFGAVEKRFPDATVMRLWALSNGFDFILATQTVIGTPDERDLDEGHSTVMNLDYR